MLTNFLRAVLSPFASTSKPAPIRRTRLNLERLESREVPATWPVLNTNPSGMWSLSWALTAANTHQNADATIAIAVSGTISLTSPLPTIGKNVTINTTVDGITVTRAATAGNFRIFTVGSSTDCRFNNVTITNGKVGTGGEGAGIWNAGELYLDQCVVKSNDATGGSGGGIFNATSGTLTLRNTRISGTTEDDHWNLAKEGGGIYNRGTLNTISTINYISRNRASEKGGGIYNAGTATFGALDYIEYNECDQDGGGIYNSLDGSLTMTELSSLSYNYSYRDGGGIYSLGTASMTKVKIWDNYAIRDGGGFYVGAGTATFTEVDFQFNDVASGGHGKGGYSKQGTTTRTNCTGQAAGDFEEFQ